MNIAKDIFKLMKKEDCKQITFHFDKKNNVKVVLAIDSFSSDFKSTVSGGTRFAHTDPDDALLDALHLSKAMTRKANVLNVDEGGAKAVVVADVLKTNEVLESIGNFIQAQKGLFKTAIDMGFTLDDATKISKKTSFIDSLSHSQKGLGSTGENTAHGMVFGLEVVAKRLLDKKLPSCSVAIQGLGAVGGSLAKKLKSIGCDVVASDISKETCKKFEKQGIRIVQPEDILFQKVDILSPCAFGGVISEKSIKKLNCSIIAAGANNPLSDEQKDVMLLDKRGILFVPEFVLNAGGFLQALVEREGGSVTDARDKCHIISQRIKELIQDSQENNSLLLNSAKKLFEKNEIESSELLGGKNEKNK